MSGFPTKSKIHAAGAVLEYAAAGAGTPGIVLVNGSGGPIEGWYRIFAPIAEFTRVFAYNRPGIGGSAKPQEPQIGSHMVATLRSALQDAGWQSPFILVGHSLGGLIVNLFARLYPHQVAGVVLIEATAPQDIAVLQNHENAVQRQLKKLLMRIAPPDPLGETEHLPVTVSEILHAPPFPQVPLTVITGGKPALAWATPKELLAARTRHQRALATLSPQGKQIMAPHSGHFPQLSEPQLVISAIREMVDGVVATPTIRV